MAKNIVIAGGTFNDVPSVEFTKTDGGTATFYDCVGSATATENKTYDVTGLASLIVNVAGGGGLPSGLSKIAFGTYTFSSDMTGNSGTGSQYMKTITHNLGVVPDIILFYSPKNVAYTYSMLAMFWGSSVAWRGSSYPTNVFYHGNSTTTVTGNSASSSYGIRDVNATTFNIKTYSNSSSYYWRAGTYNWIAVKFA